MHSASRLREYLEEHDQPLSSATGARELGWAGDYQRRSPHATINGDHRGPPLTLTLTLTFTMTLTQPLPYPYLTPTP